MEAKALPNRYVLAVTLFVSLGGILAGSITGPVRIELAIKAISLVPQLPSKALNGVLETEGFKATFSQLYITDEGEDNNFMINDSSHISEYNQTQRCSSGNGAASDSWIGIVVSSVNIGGLCGSILAGWIADRFSRKYGLLISGLLLMVGSSLVSASFYIWMILIGRLLSGFSLGMIYMVVPIYVAEVSPKEFRGIFGSLIGPMYTVGILLSLGVNAGFAKFYLGWRVVFFVGILLGLMYVIGMKFVPNTPRWLVMKGLNHEALLVLSKLNHSSSQETAVDTLFGLEELKDSITASPNWRKYYALFKEWKYRLLLTILIFFLEASLGQFILMYSTTIFCEVGINAFNAALVVGMVLLIASVVLTLFIDKVGRKTLFLLCTAMMFVLMLTLAILIQLFKPLSGLLVYVAVIFLCLYAFGYACSWLTLPWVINSEIFPTTIRGMTVMISTGCYWFSATVVVQLVPLLIGSPLQLHGLFYILAGLLLFGFFLILLVLPETKGVSLEYMNVQFSSSIWERFTATFRCHSSAGQVQQEKSNKQCFHESVDVKITCDTVIDKK